MKIIEFSSLDKATEMHFEQQIMWDEQAVWDMTAGSLRETELVTA